jgi:hypothetical protein
VKRKFLVLAVLALAGFAALGATCRVVNLSFEEINDRDVFGGELVNESGVDVLDHKIRVSFLDNDGNVVEVQTVEGCLRSLPNNGSNPFSARATTGAGNTFVALARMANLAEDPDFRVGEATPSDITIDDVTVTRDGDEVTVTGTIINNDNDEIFDVVVCAVLRGGDDDDSPVIVTGKDTTLEDLDEDDTDTFSITLGLPENDPEDATHVDIHVDALDEDDNPVVPDSLLTQPIEDAATPEPTNTATPTATPTP